MWDVPCYSRDGAHLLKKHLAKGLYDDELYSSPVRILHLL